MKRVLILSGDGVNCEHESARAFRDAGGVAEILHVNRLLENPELLLEYSVFCLPGGFSFGDELRSGKILAEKMRVKLKEVFPKFLKNKGMVIGICNGFQVLIQLGVFPEVSDARVTTLATNDHGKFYDAWVRLDLSSGYESSPWFRGMGGSCYLPIRHKEGRIVLKEGWNGEVLSIPLRYHEPVNGAYDQAAALLDGTGQILGLMPHPEAATEAFLNPLNLENSQKQKNADLVKQLFKNAIEWRG